MPRPRKSSYDEDKPPFSYVALCAMAIQSAPNKLMTLSQIYKFIVDNFPFYQRNSTRWQNSLRHNLSFNDCFVKVSKTSDHDGKGNYWTLHHNCKQMFEDGSFLRRKRRFLSREDDDFDASSEHLTEIDSVNQCNSPTLLKTVNLLHPTDRRSKYQPFISTHPKRIDHIDNHLRSCKQNEKQTRLKSFNIADILQNDTTKVKEKIVPLTKCSDFNSNGPSPYHYYSHNTAAASDVIRNENNGTNNLYHPYRSNERRSMNVEYNRHHKTYKSTKMPVLVHSTDAVHSRHGFRLFPITSPTDVISTSPHYVYTPKQDTTFDYDCRKCVFHSF